MLKRYLAHTNHSICSPLYGDIPLKTFNLLYTITIIIQYTFAFHQVHRYIAVVMDMQEVTKDNLFFMTTLIAEDMRETFLNAQGALDLAVDIAAMFQLLVILQL